MGASELDGRYRKARARIRRDAPPYCGICGGYVDKALPRYDPGAPVVDHIVPIALGGSPYDEDNMQLTHNRCNLQKGAHMRQVHKGPRWLG